jgi:tRNA-dihydrouridine synthase
VEQKYRGSADWDFIRRVKADFPDWTVVGTGDLLEPCSAIEMLEQTGADAVGAARGVLGNPWFFSQVRDCAAGREPQIPAIAEQRRVLELHFEGALELYGPQRAPRIMRKAAIKYARMHTESKKVRMAFVECMSPAQWQGILDEYYS